MLQQCVFHLNIRKDFMLHCIQNVLCKKTRELSTESVVEIQYIPQILTFKLSRNQIYSQGLSSDLYTTGRKWLDSKEHVTRFQYYSFNKQFVTLIYY